MSPSSFTKCKNFILDLYSNRLGTEILRFIVVGLIATILHYGIYLILLKYCGLRYEISYPVGYLISLVANYFLSNYYTFNSKPNVLNSIGFAISHAINLGLHFLLMIFFVEWLGISEVIAPVFVYAIAIPTNFLLVRFALTSRFFMNKK